MNRQLIKLDQAETQNPSLNLATMQLLFGRALDGNIALARKEDGIITQRGFLPVKDLHEIFPTIQQHFLRDSYHGISIYFGTAQWRDPVTNLPATGRKANNPFSARCKENLRYLPACFSDLDCGRSDQDAKTPEQKLSWRYAAAEAGELMDSGAIPQATIIARSGRGVYLFWLLCDEQNRQRPVKALPSNIFMMETCNKELNRRLAHLAADSNTFDATRLCRIDGSLHTGAQRRVTYLEQIPPDTPAGYIQRDATGRHYIYSLPEMAGFLSIPNTSTLYAQRTEALLNPHLKWKRPTKHKGENPLRKQGFYRLHAKRASDILTLEKYRGGFLKRGLAYPDGSVSPGRHFILTLYAEALRGQNMTPAETAAAIQSMAANCRPAYPSDPTDTALGKIVTGVYETKRNPCWRHDKLCALLGITPDLAAELQLQTLKPTALKELEHRQRKAESQTARREVSILRLLAERSLMNEEGKKLFGKPKFIKIPVSRMTRLLAARGVINPVNQKPYSREIIRQDYENYWNVFWTHKWTRPGANE